MKVKKILKLRHGIALSQDQMRSCVFGGFVNLFIAYVFYINNWGGTYLLLALGSILILVAMIAAFTDVENKV